MNSCDDQQQSEDSESSPAVKIASNAAKKLGRLYLKYKKMVGSNGTMIAIRLVRSKLRKREDGQSSTIHPEQLVHQGQLNQALSTSASSLENNNLSIIQKDALDGQFVWQFPPPYPTPSTPPPQYTLYNDQDTLVHGQPGFAKGFRKNLGGRWRRLVKRKPETSDMCAPLPPELKDQLKTIYVY